MASSTSAHKQVIPNGVMTPADAGHGSGMARLRSGNEIRNAMCGRIDRISSGNCCLTSSSQ